MVQKEMRLTVWNKMLTAELNQLYWEKIYKRYLNYNRNTNIFLALSSSSVVASWGFWSEFDILWKGLSMLSATIALATPFMNWQGSMEKALELKTEFSEISYSYEKLWVKIKSNEITESWEIENKLDELFQKLKPLHSKSIGLPNERKLARECQQEVLANRGLLGKRA